VYLIRLNQPKYTVNDQGAARLDHQSENNIMQTHQGSTLGKKTVNNKMLTATRLQTQDLERRYVRIP